MRTRNVIKLCWQGDREPLLDSFCEYQEQQNPQSDSEPAHWDVALLVSGLNFYAVDQRGRKVEREEAGQELFNVSLRTA